VPVVQQEVPRPSPAASHEERGPRTGCGVIVLAAVIALVVAAFAGLAAGFVGARVASSGFGGIIQQPASIRVLPSTTKEPVVAAAAAALPSVVNIDIRGSVLSPQSEGLPKGHKAVPLAGNGSGVVYKSSDQGSYIITNNHVVQDATQMTVQDDAGRSAQATLVGRDPETDIAVVKVDYRINAIEIADSSKLLVGQGVVAIGSPFGLEHSVTSGVVSALGRSIPEFSGSSSSAYPLVDVIQTDAAINPGNSGGALVDLQGRLVGINTAIFSDSGQSGGIGFAIPSNTAVRIAEQIISGKPITHPFIGIIGTTVTPALVTAKKLAVQQGAYVNELFKGSGAEKGGVKVGDVVMAVNGQPVRSMDDLVLLIRRTKVGETVTLKVNRKGQSLEIKVVVGNKPANIDTRSVVPTQ
jgi:S1-C subfamily serine protease